MKAIVFSSSGNTGIVKSFENNEIYTVFSTGKVKRNNSIIVGDKVEITILSEEEKIANIISIDDRVTIINRPKIANVNNFAIIMSLVEPFFSSFLLNKFLINCDFLNIKPIIVLTKSDLVEKYKKNKEEIFCQIEFYKNKYELIIIDNKNYLDYKKEFDYLNQIINNKLTVFAGQTGAGKSSTIQHFLSDDIILRTNEISKSLNRGKHTTTKTQIYDIGGNSFLADTPGFSSIDLIDIKAHEICKYWKVFKEYLNKCRFSDCVHINEIGCKVKKDVEEKLFLEFVYNDYIKIYNELISKKVRY